MWDELIENFDLSSDWKYKIEEDIEVLKEMIKSYKEADKCGLSNNDFKNEINALEHILSEYKRVLKENEELRAKWDKDTHILQNELDLTNADKINNYIPIQKLKDKIEELENANWYCESVKNQTIRVLKELLKEEE